MDSWRPRTVVGIALVVAVCAGLTTGLLVTGLDTAPSTPAEEPQPPTQSLDTEALYNETIDSVVTVYVVTAEGASSGSGFVCDSDGHLVTNQHVIDDATTVQVRFGARGEWRTATVVGEDPRSDLAVLSVDRLPDSAEPLALSNRQPRQGEAVAAVGSPLRLEGTITTGVVSGVDRSLRLPSGPLVPDVIQTDAAINPGNSGGPLLDSGGTVLGVNTARAAADNIGFTVSATMVDRVIPSLIESGNHTHPYLGVETRTVVPAIATANNLSEIHGAAIVAVDREGPAAGRLRGPQRAETVDGQRVPAGGDVIVSVDGGRIETDHDLLRYIALETEPGETVSVGVVRNGERRTVDVRLGERVP
ncbi:S1-C subfamily serine protease [Halohasta litchfieldiae]|jgi:S1-C subfamily serine protease|uniref:Serine protease, S1-C subfamily, contains C-terminal PDZ domain n=1 Tax=Halohasta litchfieldiae TaxID=1073996 RepID=A0A1H6QZJ2_9EURY|nr:trypsin-like peptidase domain-containing protein [Halohasta litchfieldiae]ATW88533.1 S1-C subfamily serine protease [Halohasta litchfieldiae]SEI49049.1 serine protease, S1-C subfamily, contains C-terminal PDZ domain [Halohasta litchfieldiae]